MILVHKKYLKLFCSIFAFLALALYFQNTVFPLYNAATPEEVKMEMEGRGDFIRSYVASQLSHSSKPEAVYDNAVFIETYNQLSYLPIIVKPGESWNFGWSYPPLFSLMLDFLTHFSLKTAFFLWMGIQLALFYAASYRFLWFRPSDTLMLFSPIVLLSLSWGQNGVLTAALYIAAFKYLRTIPWLSGCLFALCVYKPQLGILIPLLLLAGGFYRVLWFTIIATVALLALTVYCYGIVSWLAYFDAFASGFSSHSPITTQPTVILDVTRDLHMPTVYSLFSYLGAKSLLSMATQCCLTVYCIFRACRLGKEGITAYPLEAMTHIALLTLLAVPYFNIYDYVLVITAVYSFTMLGKNDFIPFSAYLLTACWYIFPFAELIPGGKTYFVFEPLLALVLYEYLRLDSRQRKIASP